MSTLPWPSHLLPIPQPLNTGILQPGRFRIWDFISLELFTDEGWGRPDIPFFLLFFLETVVFFICVALLEPLLTQSTPHFLPGHDVIDQLHRSLATSLLEASPLYTHPDQLFSRPPTQLSF